jgi:natural product biosynthesis luciferase-like monooxygenase protein
MDFSLFFFADDSARSDCYDLLLAAARFADANDFSAVWTPERHFHSFGGQYPNPAVIGAALAAVTERVGIRAGSVVAPLHHPVRIAEEWSVVDNLSGGRAGVSFASGWHKVDFVVRPENYTDRKKIMIDTVETVQQLWRGDEVKFADTDGGHSAVQLFPRPVQAELPIWITAAGSPETFQVAGGVGAGVLTHQLGQSHDALARNIASYRSALAAAHGEGARGHVALMLHTMIGTVREQVRETVREPLTAYLNSSFDLSTRDATTGGRPEEYLSNLPSRDKQFMIDLAFNRYLTTAGLFGTVDDGVEVVRRLAAIGVDEIACLIDFGVAPEEVLRSLRHLGELRMRTAQLQPQPR